eukprot:jgi/Mesvir1/6786/Mv18971-RA.1
MQSENATSAKKRRVGRPLGRKAQETNPEASQETKRQDRLAEAATHLDAPEGEAGCPLAEATDADDAQDADGATQQSGPQQGAGGGRPRRHAQKHFKLEDLDLLSDDVVKQEMEGAEARVASIATVCDLTSATQLDAAFDMWYSEIRAGFNLLFAGRGSKKALLDKFAADRLRREAAVAVVHGYHPSTTLKSTLGTVVDAIASVSEGKGAGTHSSSVAGMLAYITRRRDPAPPPVYLLLHSIDGSNLRGHECQVALSAVAASSNVRVVASINHVNASLLWDGDTWSNFGWLGHTVDTGMPYIAEGAHRPRALKQEAGGCLHRSAPVVLRSLTPSAQRVFRTLAEMQLRAEEQGGAKGGAAEGGSNASTGISFTAWYNRCRLSFLVSSELALRSMLTEFKDHALVTAAASNQRHGAGGQHELRIPLPADVLRGILAGMDQ